MCSSGSNANLFRLPFGVSITTRSICLLSESKGFRRVGSASPFFLPILPPSHEYRGCSHLEEGLLLIHLAARQFQWHTLRVANLSGDETHRHWVQIHRTRLKV